MTRASNKEPLKKADVIQAAVWLLIQGEKPTTDKVLAHIGHGSKETIGKYLKPWMDEQLTPIYAAIDSNKALREDIGIMMLISHYRATHSLNERLTQVEASRDEMEKEMRRLKFELDLCQTEVEVKSQRLIKADGAADEQRHLIADLNRTVEQLTAELAVTRERQNQLDKLMRQSKRSSPRSRSAHPEKRA